MPNWIHDLVQRIVTELVAVGLIIGSLGQWLPSAGALLAIIWYLLQIWESRTGQCLRAKIMGHPKQERPILPTDED